MILYFLHIFSIGFCFRIIILFWLVLFILSGIAMILFHQIIMMILWNDMVEFEEKLECMERDICFNIFHKIEIDIFQ